MTLHNARWPEDAEGLSPLERAQLRIAGNHFDGQDRAAELRFIDQPIPQDQLDQGIDWDDGNFTGHLLSAWEVHVDGVHRYDVWIHHADNGTLFVAGTTDVVADRCQSRWMSTSLGGDWPDAGPLDAAMRAVEVW